MPGNYPEESIELSENGENLKSRISLIAHAFVVFNVFLRVMFITLTNFQQFIRKQMTFKITLG